MAFIEPYAGLRHLQSIRDQLDETAVKEYRRYSHKMSLVPFPGEALLMPEESKGLKKIYSLLTTLDIHKDVSYAEFLRCQKRREQLVKILWVAGLYGRFDPRHSEYLEMEGKEIYSQKINGMYHIFSGFLEEMKKYGVNFTVVTTDAKRWLTPTGGLRKEGWLLRVSMGETQNDAAVLPLLKKYVTRLSEKHGKNALARFNRADMEVMTH